MVRVCKTGSSFAEATKMLSANNVTGMENCQRNLLLVGFISLILSKIQIALIKFEFIFTRLAEYT